MPQRRSRPPWPQIRIMTSWTGTGSGIEEIEKGEEEGEGGARVRRARCSGSRVACIGCRVSGRRRDLEREVRESWEGSMEGM